MTGAAPDGLQAFLARYPRIYGVLARTDPLSKEIGAAPISIEACDRMLALLLELDTAIDESWPRMTKPERALFGLVKSNWLSVRNLYSQARDNLIARKMNAPSGTA